jgi:Zn-dependent protease
MIVSFYFHEIGHYLVAKKFNIYIESVNLTALGGSTLIGDINDAKENLLVSLTGPLFGFISLVFIYPYLEIFVNINYHILVICLSVALGNGLNLMPIKGSDGYYALKSIKKMLC